MCLAGSKYSNSFFYPPKLQEGTLRGQSSVPHSFSLDVLLLLKAKMTMLVALLPPNGSIMSVLWKRGASLFTVESCGQGVNTLKKMPNYFLP